MRDFIVHSPAVLIAVAIFLLPMYIALSIASLSLWLPDWEQWARIAMGVWTAAVMLMALFEAFSKSEN